MTVPYLVICSSLKDVMAFKKLGYKNSRGFGESSFYSFAAEYKSPFAPQDLEKLSVTAYKVMFFFAAFLTLANIKKIKIRDFVLLIPFFYLSAKFIRNIPLFALFCALIMPAYADNSFDALARFLKRRQYPASRIIEHIQGSLLIAGCALIIWVSIGVIFNSLYIRDLRSRRFGFGVTELVYPVKALEFIKSNNIQGEIINDYGSGTAVNCWLFPRYRSFYAPGSTAPSAM